MYHSSKAKLWLMDKKVAEAQLVERNTKGVSLVREGGSHRRLVENRSVQQLVTEKCKGLMC